MKMRKLIIGMICVVLILTASVVVMQKNNLSIGVGTCIEADNGRYLVVLDNSPIEMYPCSGKESIFSELSTGDTIFIVYGFVEYSYPGKTGVYCIVKLSNGNENNVPEEVITRLQELHWLNKTDEQT